MDKARLSLLRFVLVGLALAAPVLGCSTNNSKPGGLGGAANPGLGGAGGGAPDAGTDTPVTTDAIPDVPATTPVKLVFGPPALMMTEGQAMPGVLTISLDREWSTDITVTIAASNPNVATVVEGTVTFPAMTMGQKEIHVLAPVDDDTVDDTTTIVASAPETGAQIVTVSVTDPDIQSLLAFPPKVSMTEGRTESLSLRLAKKPTSAVVVTLASSDLTKLTLDTTSLTFDPTNYSIPVPITLTALKDDDAMSEHESIALTATGKIQSLSVPVEITDIDAVNMDITPSSIALVERANMPGTIMVSLTKAPPNDVNVTVMPSDMTKIAVSSTLLAFTPANYATPQLVQVSAVPDNDGADESERVTLTLTGITPAPDPQDVTVTVKDMDSQMITASPGAVTLGEGTTGSFSVQLTLVPTGDTTVNVFPQNPDKVRVLPPVLHFNASNYNMAQTVAIQAAQDDDLADDDVNITLIASSGATATVATHIVDDDHQAILLVPAGGGTSLTMQEGANSALGVRLAFRPAAPATVNLVAATLGGGPSKLSVSSAQVPFSAADYAMPKFVTLTAAHLPDLADVMASLTASMAGSPDVMLPVKILDIDIQNLLISPDSVSVSEGGGVAGPAASFTVSLTQQPPSPVTPTFMLSPNLAGSATTPAKAMIDASACQALTGAAAMTGCKVSVTALPDADTRNESGTVTIAATTTDVDGHTLMFTRTVAVTVTDSDTQGLNIFVGGAKVDPAAAVIPPIVEQGTGKFTVALTADPVDQVVASVFSNDPAHFTVSPSTLAFNSGNYAGGIEVTVTSVDDNDIASYKSTITVQGAAAGATNPGTATVSVSETNMDIQSIALSPGPGLTMLEGGMAQIGVRLAFRPDGDEIVDLSSADTTKLTLDIPSLTFGANYSTNQFVTLTALPDVNMGNHDVLVTATSRTATTPAAQDKITIMDIDSLNFVVSGVTPANLALTEGGATGKFTVGLTVTPKAEVKVKLDSTLPVGSMTATFDGGTCTLASKMDKCNVTVTAIADDNALNEAGTITISDMAGTLTPVVLNASTIDSDTQAIDVFGPASSTIKELNGMTTTTFIVALRRRPAGTTQVGISVMPAAMDGIMVSPTTLSFSSAGTFDTTSFGRPEFAPQMVTITSIPDCDLTTDPFSIRVTAPGLGVSDAFVNVSEVDDDTQQIIISKCDQPPPLGNCRSTDGDLPNDDQRQAFPGMVEIAPLAEGASYANAFCVSLKFQPLSNTVVDVAATPAAPKLAVDAAHLSFSTLATTASNPTGGYDKPQPLSFTSMSDTDAASQAATVNLSSSGFAATRGVGFVMSDPNYCAAATPTPMCMAAGVTDINACATCQHLAFSGLDAPTDPNAPPTTITIHKGHGGTVGLNFQFDPVTTTTVDCKPNDPDSGLVTITNSNGGTFSFTGGQAGNWSAAQTLRFTVGNGSSSALTESQTITCSPNGSSPAVAPRSFIVTGIP